MAMNRNFKRKPLAGGTTPLLGAAILIILAATLYTQQPATTTRTAKPEKNTTDLTSIWESQGNTPPYGRNQRKSAERDETPHRNEKWHKTASHEKDNPTKTKKIKIQPQHDRRSTEEATFRRITHTTPTEQKEGVQYKTNEGKQVLETSGESTIREQKHNYTQHPNHNHETLRHRPDTEPENTKTAEGKVTQRARTDKKETAQKRGFT